jgi:CHAD domain-containing protein
MHDAASPDALPLSPRAGESPQKKTRRSGASLELGRRYLLPQGLSATALLSRLADQFRLQNGASVPLNRSFYDTPDWRLHASGLVLEGTSDEDSVALSLTDFIGASEVFGVVDQAPSFTHLLPEGPLRDALDPLCSVRRLVPVVHITGRASPLRVLDGERKTVVRLRLERRNYIDAADPEMVKPAPPALWVTPVKGYTKRHKAVLQFIESELGMSEADEHDMTAALQSLARTPNFPTAKFIVPLSHDLRADEAMKRVHGFLLDVIEANVEGTKQDIDSEFLHDLRVSVRRTRAALGQVKDVFPMRTLQRFKMEFRWLGQATGPVRDLDVYLIKLPGYLQELSAADRVALVPLQRFLVRRQAQEQAELAASLETARFRRLIEGWRGFLDQPVPQRSRLVNAQRPVADVAQERIWKAYRKVLKGGRAITPTTPAVAVHDLRLVCKKLRYLMETFRGLYPAKAIGKAIKALKALQANLGDFNDYAVQQEAMGGFARDMLADHQAPAETVMAMGRLVDLLVRREAGARVEFATRFAAFDTETTFHDFHTLFQSPAGEPTA